MLFLLSRLMMCQWVWQFFLWWHLSLELIANSYWSSGKARKSVDWVSMITWLSEIMSSVGSIVLFMTVVVLCDATGHGQLVEREKKISTSFNVYHDQKGALSTRRIRQSSELSTSNHTLTCHQCRSFEDGDQCIHLPANSSIFNEPCGSHQTACMVNEIS